MHRTPPFWLALVASVLLTGCGSVGPETPWETHTVRLGEARVSLSAPRAHINKNPPSVDLATNAAPFTVLFKRAWIASGLVADKGGMELQLLLRRHHARAMQQPFMEAVRVDYQTEVGRLSPGMELVNHTTRKIGTQQWACFEVTKIQVSDCVLELPDGQHYLGWQRTWIANTTGQVPVKFSDLAERIERSVELAF